ncbi:MAG TPA: threonine synthase [Candidatus Pullichristensenella avicola]|nr:threonine synthase [Candidatus Pullichristensenella avicola]
MKFYQSTRGGARVAACEAILEGIAPDGGLYTPEEFPRLDMEKLREMDALEISTQVLAALLDGFSEAEMARIVREGYAGKFETEDLTPVVKAGDVHVLELFRGPTSAFKDVALSLLPRLMTASRDKAGAREEIAVLTATSGDTGKAALEGFCDVPDTRIVVFYPEDGVSDVQKAQMRTQRGQNVRVCAVRGNFDDAQTGVKAVFADDRAHGWAARENTRLSSANSINLGRLAPQVAYYFKSYLDLARRGEIAMGEAVNFVVPTGNFGDILAGDFARRMGLPVARLVCASNANNVLTDFIRTGVYDRRRAFHKTASPSMDILVSSNLERYLYLESGRDAALVARLMRELTEKGVYTAPESVRKALAERFWAGCADDAAAFEAIARVWRECGYLLDTHTAVAWAVCEQFRREADNGKKTVVLATASPYKFAASVLTALGRAPAPGFAALDELNALTGVSVPKNLAAIRDLPALHTDVVDKADILSYVKEALR